MELNGFIIVNKNGEYYTGKAGHFLSLEKLHKAMRMPKIYRTKGLASVSPASWDECTKILPIKISFEPKGEQDERKYKVNN